MKLKKVPQSGKVDLSRFELELFETVFSEKLASKLLKPISKEIESYIKEETSIYFPIMYSKHDDNGIGGPAEKNPDVMYLGLPLGEYQDENIFWSFKLSDVVTEMLEYYSYLGRKKYGVSPKSAHICISLRDHLRALADEIDEAVENGKLDPPEKEET